MLRIVQVILCICCLLFSICSYAADQTYYYHDKSLIVPDKYDKDLSIAANKNDTTKESVAISLMRKCSGGYTSKVVSTKEGRNWITFGVVTGGIFPFPVNCRVYFDGVVDIAAP